MKYYEQEYEPLEELLQFRESIKSEYLKQKGFLDARKELLYKSDIS